MDFDSSPPSFFGMRTPVVQHKLLKKLFLLLLNCFGNLVRNKFPIYERFYFRALSSISLTYLSILIPIAGRIYFCSTMINILSSGGMSLPILFFFIIYLAIVDSLHFCINLGLACQFLKEKSS